MAEDNRTLWIGTLIHQRYRIEQVLGAGGFGITYRVTDTQTGERAAMKEYMPRDIAVRAMGRKAVIPLKDSVHAYERFREQFLEEAKTIYRFRGHPHIVEVTHLFYENNTAYYVMEFLDGQDLAHLLRSSGGTIAWNILRPILEQVVDALEAVHRENMIHCDISPENICLLGNGQVKLIDFGAAKSRIRTPSSFIVMRRGYAPPEQMLANGNLGPWTDEYALAVTIYRCFTGKMPPPAEDRLVKDTVVSPSEMGLPLPSEMWEWELLKGMSLRSEERYHSISTFWNALNRQPAPPIEQERPYMVLGCWDSPSWATTFHIRREAYLGTDPHRCDITYPPGTPGVSRVHLRIWPEDEALFIMDMSSTYGTWLDGIKLVPGLVYSLHSNSQITFGDNLQLDCRIYEPWMSAVTNDYHIE